MLLYVEQGKAHDTIVNVFSKRQCVSPVCSWEDYVGQVEMATAIAAFKAEQGDSPKPTAPGIGDRKEMKKLQEVRSQRWDNISPALCWPVAIAGF